MTLRQTINIIKKNKPKDLKAFKKLGLKLKFVGSGCFRNVYQINNLSVVVKFPVSLYEDLDHCKSEISVLRRINKLKKYKFLKKHTPKLYYGDCRSGVIVMEKAERFKSFKEAENNIDKLPYKIQNTVDDLHAANVGRIGKRTVIFDLGLM